MVHGKYMSKDSLLMNAEELQRRLGFIASQATSLEYQYCHKMEFKKFQDHLEAWVRWDLGNYLDEIKVICDDSINTPESISMGVFVFQILVRMNERWFGLKGRTRGQIGFKEIG